MSLLPLLLVMPSLPLCSQQTEVHLQQQVLCQQRSATQLPLLHFLHPQLPLLLQEL
jgi:hypothetical protein